MTDYTAWPEKMATVVSLQLDPQNPRIPPAPASLTQRELIAELVQHDKVYELARNITEQGYYPLESLVGFIDDGKTVILEGNRRLAVLKLLTSPESAPDKHVKRFRALSSKVPPDSIKRVRVLYAPSREAAAPLLMQKHTRETIARWSPVMQARFYRSLVNAGATPQEIAQRYGTSAGEVTGFLRTDGMYEAACAMDLPEPVRAFVHNPRDFPVSIIDRLMDIPQARQFLGITFDEQGVLRGTVHPDEFSKGYTRILTDIAGRKIDSRRLNKVEDVEKYLARISSSAPALSRRGNFTIQDLKKGLAQTPPSPPAPSKPTRSASPRPSSVLIPSSMKCGVLNPRIREIFIELRRLKVDRFPNACAAMLRILLELSIGHYLDRSGKIAPLLSKAKKDGRPRDWYPTWKMMLRAMLDDPDIQLAPLARKALNKLADQHSSLDGFVHNRFEIASPQVLRVIASALEELLDVVLQEPPRKAKPGTAQSK